MIDTFVFLYVEEEKVWLLENMYALKNCLIALRYKYCQGSATKFKSCQGSTKTLHGFKTNSKRVQCWRSGISKGKVKDDFFEFGKMFQAGIEVLWNF